MIATKTFNLYVLFFMSCLIALFSFISNNNGYTHAHTQTHVYANTLNTENQN